MIKFLLTHLLFMGTMFAAGAPAITGGSGGATPPPTGGTGGEGGGTGDTGGTGGSGQAITTGEGGTTGETSAEDADFGTFEDFDAPDEAAQASSGEEFGPETYKKLKKAIANDPALFKEVKKAVSMVKRYQEHFETPEAAAELMTDLTTHGGWDAVKQELGETATFLNGWNAGDPEVVKAWLKENGDGLSKNMPTVAAAWLDADPQGWSHYAAQTFIATLNQAPVGGISALAALSQIGNEELKNGGTLKDSEGYKRLASVIEAVKGIAEKAPQPQQKGPDEGKLTAREQQLARQEQNLRKQALAGEAQPVLQKEAMNALKLVAGSRKLSEESRGNLLSDIHREFARLMEKDADGKAKRQKLLAAGQKDQWLKMVRSAASRTMPLAARNVWRKYAGISGISAQQKEERKAEGQQRREAGGSGTQQGIEEKAVEYDSGRRPMIDYQAMIKMFGSRNAADDAFLFGSPKHGGRKVWIHKETGKLYMIPK
jgi:hypothetical protein